MRSIARVASHGRVGPAVPPRSLWARLLPPWEARGRWGTSSGTLVANPRDEAFLKTLTANCPRIDVVARQGIADPNQAQEQANGISGSCCWTSPRPRYIPRWVY